jgi:hypothetical protein
VRAKAIANEANQRKAAALRQRLRSFTESYERKYPGHTPLEVIHKLN